MARVNPYLTFNGNCREAMTFYKQCLGGELSVQTVGESPMADKLPAQMKEHVMHAALTSGDIVILASDMAPKTLNKGNNVSLLIDCTTEEEVRAKYDRLAAGGEATHPIEKTFWGALFGTLTDKYGNQWMLNFAETPQG